MDALEAILRRTPVAADLSSEQWSEFSLGLRNRSLFSAHVENIRFLAESRRQLEQLAQGKVGRTEARDTLAKLLGSFGDTSIDQADLRDIRSEARQNLIIDTNLAQAQGYARMVRSQDPEALDAFPCQELIRVSPSEKERDWQTRWREAGGATYRGRMIARKTAPIWSAISRFGTPYPPFDFNSGMDVVSIDREEAEELGVIPVGAKIEPEIEDFNAHLEASLPDSDPAILEGFREIFGDQVDTRQGKVVWRGQRIRDTYAAALADPQFKRTLELGRASDQARALARQAGVEILPDAQLKLTADEIRKVHNKRGQTEQQADQRPVTALDFELLPHVWREPDAVRPGDQAGDLVFEKTLLGRSIFVTWKPAPKTGAVKLQTFYVKKEGGEP